MFQGEGAPSWTPLVPPYHDYPLHHDSRAPPPEQSGRAPSCSPPFAAPRASTRQAPRPPPPAFEVPPQPSTSGWVLPGPPPPRSRHGSSGSDSEASESESVTSARDSASARLADLIYEVCPDSRPLFDTRAPRCGFEAWFGRPEAAALKQRFRLYPRVAEVQDEVAARSESLARRSKPLSRVIPTRAHAYALADAAVFASSQPVTSAFAQLASSGVFGSRGSSVCVDGVSSRPPVVAPSPSSVSRSVSLPGVSRPTFCSDVGWGAHLDRQIASGLWDAQQAALSINARELLAVKLGLHQFQSSLQSRTVAVFCDNTTAVIYLRKEGGTSLSSTP